MNIRHDNDHQDRDAGFWSLLRARIVRGRERGDALIEVLIFTAIISIVVTSYASSSQSANQVSRKITAIEIVDQQGQATMERAQVQPWDTLGFN